MSILICNVSIPLCCIQSLVSLVATQMLLFAGCCCAVFYLLFRGRTNRKQKKNRKPLSSSSSSLLSNSFEHRLPRPVSVSTTGINFTTANPLDQIWRDSNTRLKRPHLSWEWTPWSRVTTPSGSFSHEGRTSFGENITGKTVF